MNVLEEEEDVVDGDMAWAWAWAFCMSVGGTICVCFR